MNARYFVTREAPIELLHSARGEDLLRALKKDMVRDLVELIMTMTNENGKDELLIKITPQKPAFSSRDHYSRYVTTVDTSLFCRCKDCAYQRHDTAGAAYCGFEADNGDPYEMTRIANDTYYCADAIRKECVSDDE